MRTLFLLALVLLAGCETAQGDSDKAFSLYRGKDVEQVFQRWGAPGRTISTADGPVYLWENMAPARDCRVEAHADDGRLLKAFRYVGDEQSCVTWLRLLLR